MPKYIVHAQITIFQEIAVEAETEEEAVEAYKEQLEDLYGWVDFDTVYVNDKQM